MKITKRTQTRNSISPIKSARSPVFGNLSDEKTNPNGLEFRLQAASVNHVTCHSSHVRSPQFTVPKPHCPNPRPRTRSNQVKPSQTRSNRIKPNQTESNRIKPKILRGWRRSQTTGSARHWRVGTRPGKGRYINRLIQLVSCAEAA